MSPAPVPMRDHLSAGPRDPLQPNDPDFAGTVRTVLSLPLDAFAESGQCLEVRVPWCPEPLWFVPTEADAEDLAAEGVGRGPIWTADELGRLWRVPRIDKERARHLILAKLAFDGELSQVKPATPAEPERCYVCKGRRWWRSVYGMTVCATCHPPATPQLVAEWLGTRAESEAPRALGTLQAEIRCRPSRLSRSLRSPCGGRAAHLP